MSPARLRCPAPPAAPAPPPQLYPAPRLAALLSSLPEWRLLGAADMARLGMDTSDEEEFW